MIDKLGERIKGYESITRNYVPRRTYTILRLDGKAFHTYTRGLKKPYDHDLSIDIDEAVKVLMKNIQGAVFAYCQSDEISILVTDFASITTTAWFDGNVQKISSVSASILTAEFNRNRMLRKLGAPDFHEYKVDGEALVEPFYSYDPGYLQDIFASQLAHFDCRTFFIPDRVEVMNYFRWRSQDCIRNSISMAAQQLFSPKELHKKSTVSKLEMIKQKTGISWEEYDAADKYGRFITKSFTTEMWHPKLESTPAWRFTGDENRLLNLIPTYPE